jgi:hypothetical protein
MTTEYKYRGTFLIPKSKKSAINSQVKLNIDEDGGENTFDVGASSNGTGNPTHYYACSALTDEAIATIADMAVAFPSAKGWVWVDHSTGDIASLNSAFGSINNIEVEEKMIDDILSENNLQKMETE